MANKTSDKSQQSEIIMGNKASNKRQQAEIIMGNKASDKRQQGEIIIKDQSNQISITYGLNRGNIDKISIKSVNYQ